MATYTTNLALRKPERSAGNDDIVDVFNDVSSNLDILDQNCNMRVVTSSSRPSGPYVGMMIYETDTGIVRIWNNSIWENVGTDNTSRGKKGLTISQTPGATLTSASAETMYMTCTWTAESDRNYWIIFSGNIECTATTAAPGSAAVTCRWKAGAVVGTGDTALWGSGLACVQGTGTNNIEHFYKIVELPAATHATNGSVTVGISLSSVGVNDSMRISGSATLTNQLLVRDVGI